MTPAEPDFTGTARLKSSVSHADFASCVEVAFVPGWIGVRDSKQHGNGPVLTFTDAEWDAFLAGVHNAEFARPER